VKTGRGAPKTRDARAESGPPPATVRDAIVASDTVIRAPPRDLEVELESLRSARAQDADDLAAMLVRVADLERARTAAEKRSAELAARVEELEGEIARARTATLGAEDRVRVQGEEHEKELTAVRARLAEMSEGKERAESAAREAAQRADSAEEWVAEVTTALEQVQDGLDAGRKRVADLEAEVAKLKDHQDEERRAASRLLENERSTSGRARQQAAAAEARLRRAQAAVTSLTAFIDRLEAADKAAFDARTTILAEARSLVTLEKVETERQPVAAPLAKATDRGESAILDALDVDLRK
jgi:chromosome segregation ATPase